VLRDFELLTGKTSFPDRLRSILLTSLAYLSGQESGPRILKEYFIHATTRKIQGSRLLGKRSFSEFRAAVEPHETEQSWLHIAAQEANGDVIREIAKEHQHELNGIPGKDSTTPLQAALLCGNTSALLALIDLGADVRTLFGDSFIHTVIQSGDRLSLHFIQHLHSLMSKEEAKPWIEVFEEVVQAHKCPEDGTPMPGLFLALRANNWQT
jgi:hypothetical protein